MKRFSVAGQVTISIYTIVEAESAEQAMEIAEGRDLPNLCHQCAGAGDENVQWSLTGELDGMPEVFGEGTVETAS